MISSVRVRKLFCLLALFMSSLLVPMPKASATDNTITVNENCSLHDAIKAANEDRAVNGCPAGDGKDVIMLTDDVSLKGMLPPISSRIAIEGEGYRLIGDRRDRLLHVKSGRLSIDRLTLTAGKRAIDAGGAIRVESGARHFVYDSVFSRNEAQHGGAIANFGFLRMDKCKFSDNRAIRNDGAIHNEGEALIINNSVFERNWAGDDGGAVNIHAGFIDFRHNYFSHNEADSEGGGIAAYDATITIKDSTLEDNRARFGGAIDVSWSVLNIIESSLLNNSAENGGALKSYVDTVSVRESVISGNTADRQGGGIYGQAKELTIYGSTIDDNSGSSGGGFYTDKGLNTITASTFSGNSADWVGGAVYSEADRLEIRNSTFYSNRAIQTGGGLYLEEASSLAHLTIAHNSAGEVGGIYIRDGDTQLVNSIIAGNRGEDCSGRLVKNVNNLIEDGTCDPWLQGDPMLLGLWGLPATFVLAEDSPAVDAGDPTLCTLLDQSGWGRDKGCYLGAFEFHPSRSTPFISLRDTSASEPEQDPLAGIVVDEGCTLADAISAANSGSPYGACPAGNPDADKITLTADVTLSDELPAITSEITIDGAGHTISGANEFRIFTVAPGPLTVNDITLTDGSAPSGAAIHSLGGTIILNRSVVTGNEVVGNFLAYGGGIGCFPCSLSINDSVISNNSASNEGGGIFFHNFGETNALQIRNSIVTGNSANWGGGLHISNSSGFENATISNSMIFNNRAAYHGGGVYLKGGNSPSRLRMDNRTLYGNRAENDGGAVFTEGDIKLTHVTIVDNGAASGGGIYTSDRGRTNLRFSIISGNSGNDCVGYPEQNIGNLIEDGTCDPALTGDPMRGDLVEPEAGTPPYYPLLPGSPAIDAAIDEYCTEADQIGGTRPQGQACDIGAIEYVPPTRQED